MADQPPIQLPPPPNVPIFPPIPPPMPVIPPIPPAPAAAFAHVLQYIVGLDTPAKRDRVINRGGVATVNDLLLICWQTGNEI
jgi:hypothetical protein